MNRSVSGGISTNPKVACPGDLLWEAVNDPPDQNRRYPPNGMVGPRQLGYHRTSSYATREEGGYLAGSSWNALGEAGAAPLLRLLNPTGEAHPSPGANLVPTHSMARSPSGVSSY